MVSFNSYCINLAERTDRWNKFISQNIPFDVKHYNAIKRDNGSYGIIASVLDIIGNAKDNILIFEDDCHILQDWEIFYKAVEQLPDDWDMLYLGANLHEIIERYSDNLFLLKKGWATHGVLYNKKIFEKILSDADGIIRDRNIDSYYAKRIQPEGHCFIIYPCFATQYPNHSDIVNSFRSYDDLLPNYEKYTR